MASVDWYLPQPPNEGPNTPKQPICKVFKRKWELLVAYLPPNKAEAGDIPPDTPTAATCYINFPPITAEDVRQAVIEAGNTAPGADEVPVAVLQAAWRQIHRRVTTFFQQCLHDGHHPACFRTAILAIIPQPNKADYSSLRSHRPIALLSVLGKGLERLLAYKMAWPAVTLEVTNSQ